MTITVRKDKKPPKALTSRKDFARVELTEKENGLVERAGVMHVRVAVGKQKLSRRKAAMTARKSISLAKSHEIQTLFLDVACLLERVEGMDAPALADTLVAEAMLANFEFSKYKTGRKRKEVKELILFYKNDKEIQKAVRRAQTIAREVNNCRVLANTPGGEMTPTLLADAAEGAAEGTDIRVDVLGKREMERLGMGAVLGVAQGSIEEPKFIIMEYMAGERDEKPIVLVGKGVTFDTGGLNLKPAGGINDMHLDMSGGAAVIYSVVLAAKLKIKKNVVGLVPAVENMPSGSSYRPGDILKSMSGKTIEVLNTDAEGRIILADALHYAKRYKPAVVIDVATLTGAALVALGQRASALFTRDRELQEILTRLGEESGEYVWPLPLWEEYERDMQGTFGDVANDSKVRWGGAIQGAVFLLQFAKQLPRWVHIDIAPRMTAADDEHLAKGAVGAPVRLLIRFIEAFNLQKK